MATDRPAVPAALKRQLYEESGYRCAIPTCGTPGPLELAHIEPWAKVREHVFENMIALCRNDHFRFDNGEIPVQSVRVFKANLAVVHNRYSEIERRLLKTLGAKPAGGSLIIDGGDFVRLSLMNVVSDGLVSRTEAEAISIVVSVPENPIRMEMGDDGRPRVVPGTGDSSGGRDRYALTPRGVEFVSRWFGAEPLLTL